MRFEHDVTWRTWVLIGLFWGLVLGGVGTFSYRRGVTVGTQRAEDAMYPLIGALFIKLSECGEPVPPTRQVPAGSMDGSGV